MKMEEIEKLLPSRFQRFIMGRDILRPPLPMTPLQVERVFYRIVFAPNRPREMRDI